MEHTACSQPPPPLIPDGEPLPSGRGKSRDGFTLIELSIVLIIIGLIIGGILVGQDLVSAAATRATIAQIEKYNSAVNTFRNKYNGIPGDLALSVASQFGFYTPAGCTGDGAFPTGSRNNNGLIEGAGTTAPLAGLMGEEGLFWSDLATAGFVDFPGNSSISCNASVTVPATGIDSYLPTGKIGYGTHFHAYSVNGFNWYLLASFNAFSGGTSQIHSVASVPVTQAYNIDKKMDDGNPVAGSVQAVYLTGSFTATTLAPNGNPDTTSTCYNSSTNAYSTNMNNGSGPNCALSFKMQGAAR